MASVPSSSQRTGCVFVVDVGGKTPVLPELRKLPTGLVLHGELMAWKGNRPYFRLVSRKNPSLLASLDLNSPCWRTTDVFGDGEAPFASVCALGKNPNYWRRESEIAAMQRSRERRRAVKPAAASAS